MAKRVNHRLIKIHRSYTIEELARLLGCHKNTIRHWLRQGLLALNDGCRPLLIQGYTAKTFLERRQRKGKQKCRPTQMFCFKCKQPREAALSTADFTPTSPSGGVLSGLCSTCTTLMFKRTSAAALRNLPAWFEVKFLGAEGRLSSSPSPLSNCHLPSE